MAAFQLAATRRRLVNTMQRTWIATWFQLAATRRRLGGATDRRANAVAVSTRSHAKAAGSARGALWGCCVGFNSQPREGGWLNLLRKRLITLKFQLAATRRRLASYLAQNTANECVSTRSHAKAAGLLIVVMAILKAFQLAATRRRLDKFASIGNWCALFQLAATRRRLARVILGRTALVRFQLAATRRRLGVIGAHEPT